MGIVVLVSSDSRRVWAIFSAVVGCGYNGWWVDVQTNLDVTDTGVKHLPEYYRSGRFSTESHERITRYTSAGKTVKLELEFLSNGIWKACLEYSDTQAEKAAAARPRPGRRQILRM
jgi:hypothetical protein